MAFEKGAWIQIDLKGPTFGREASRNEHMSDTSQPQSSLILYQTEDGRTRIQFRFEAEAEMVMSLSAKGSHRLQDADWRNR